MNFLDAGALVFHSAMNSQFGRSFESSSEDIG
jgi:hypothetical protein